MGLSSVQRVFQREGKVDSHHYLDAKSIWAWSPLLSVVDKHSPRFTTKTTILSACENCFASFLLRGCVPDRGCIMAVEDDGHEETTLLVRYAGNQAEVWSPTRTGSCWPTTAGHAT